LTSQKRSIGKIVIAAAISVSLVGLVSVAVRDSCEVQHMGLLTDINEYEQALDPDLCHPLVERIDSFNDRCQIQLETLDCG